jgi:rRNA maturation RNase YbeY
MSCRVSVTNAHHRVRIRKAPVVELLRNLLRSEGLTQAEISVVFVGSQYIRGLHRKYLGHDVSTDVISFPLGRRDAVEGEIYVNLDRARRQAVQYHVSFKNEVYRLAIHGALHLLGYDDRSRALALIMKNVENRYVNGWFSQEKGIG